MRLRLLAFAMVTTFSAGLSHAQGQPMCAAQSVLHAKKLMRLHADNDERIEIDTRVRSLPQLRNPANNKQRFDVEEVWGHVYKANFRMRFIYFRTGSECVLMGQEILEFSRP